jgi:hypothetical protein
MSDLSDEPESILSSSRAMSRQETLRLLQQKRAAVLAPSSSSSEGDSVDPEELIDMARRASAQAASTGKGGKNQKRARLDAFTQEKLSLSLTKTRKRGKTERQQRDGDRKGLIDLLGEDGENEDMLEIRVELNEEEEEEEEELQREQELREEEDELRAALDPEGAQSARPMSATERAAQEIAARSVRTQMEVRRAEQRAKAMHDMVEIAPSAIILTVRDVETGVAHLVKVRRGEDCRMRQGFWNS